MPDHLTPEATAPATPADLLRTLAILSGIGAEVAELLSGRVLLPGPTLAELLVARRKWLRQTEREMARRSDMSASKISNFERRDAVPGTTSTYKLAMGYGLPVALVIQASLNSANLLSPSATGAKPVPRNRVRNRSV